MTNGSANDSLVGRTIVLYGRSAAPRREVERAARERGVKIAATLRESIDAIVLGEGEPTAQVRARLAAEFDERSRRAFENGTFEIVSETEFLRRLKEVRPFASASAESARSTPALPEKRDSLFDFLPDAKPKTADPPDAPENKRAESSNAPPLDAFSGGCTPAAVAELVGVSIQTIRRWRRRGLLAATVEAGLLPYFSTKQILVAKRLAFLFSTGLSEEFVESRVAAFRELAPSGESDVAAVILKTTLSSDGRDLLFAGSNGPIDRRGQRRFDFGALPTDGAFSSPAAPPFLSDAEEEIALAERLAAWNVAQNAAESAANLAPPAVPAFLSLFQNAPDSPIPTTPTEPSPPERSDPAKDATENSDPRRTPRFDFATPPAFADAELSPTLALSKAARERWRDASNRRVVQLCETAWKLETAGYWDEAVRVYRSALLAGGLDAGVSFRLGKALYLLGDFSAARERFFAALELDEDYVDARFELAKTLVALDALDDALAAFQGALEDRPDDPTFRLELGKLYLRLGRRAEAEEEFRRAVEKIDDPRLADDVWRLIYELGKRR